MKRFTIKACFVSLSLFSVGWFCTAQSLLARPLSISILQQEQEIRGTVRDADGIPLAGATILVAGTAIGTSSADDGTYTLRLPAGKTQITYNMLGYQPQTRTISGSTLDVVMLLAGNQLEELVVIGYGSSTKKDLTGAVNTVSSKDFNTGLVGSPEQLISGKAAGVQVMSNSGSPTAGSTIRIRGGASLSASNDPLIVLDGVPLETGGISGNSGNFLSLINPNDIESMTVLKDASATAIYGSRASNGVLLITTKKGKGEQLRVSFSSILSMQQAMGVADMMSRDQFAELIDSKGTAAQKALLGSASTDWLEEVFQDAFGTDNNLGLSGSIGKVVPFRASVGYYNQQGTLKTDKTERMTGSLVMNPTFFDQHLTVNLNLKGARNNNQFANTDAIWSAIAFNPTQPIYSGNEQYGGYYESLDNAGLPATGANLNPLGLLNQERHRSDVNRGIGNLDLDYKFHFLPELKAHVTLGYDYAHGEGYNHIPAAAANAFNIGGSYDTYEQTLKNKLFTGYLNYNKALPDLKSNLELTVGHDYQYWSATRPPITYLNDAGDVRSTAIGADERHTLLSWYGRLNYNYDSRYLLTATVRRDGTSRFSPENRWGTFPSLALAWRLSEESFLKESTFLNDLKLRASYGVTGQQDGIGNYSYLPVYNQGTPYAQYRFGNQYHLVYRPSVYVSDLRWETTKAFNYGLDFAVWQNRVSGSIEYYTRKTHDLLATVPVPAGTNFDQMATTNVGNIESSGFEFQLNTVPVERENLRWEVNFNATQQHMKVTNIALVEDDSSVGSYVGPVVSGRSIQILTTGYEPYMFYVYKQMYDESGRPLEGVYADLNQDGAIDEKDLYRYQSPAPKWILGFNTQVSYKKWTAATTLRANLGNYVFNNTKMNLSAWETVQYVDPAINNLHEDYLKTGFQARQYYSDYYVENASFLRMENFSLGYNVGQVGKFANLRIGAVAQNLFIISKYSGKDPEVPSGFDSSFYPRSRTYSLSLNLDF
ncbi:TonB-dependent receptor [Sphingobacterium alkalisoli]|uniref:TonB-dependent receptor n=2 Tax=Sphingobacterium TaxID=28453 RepID=A0A4U0P0H1_9SPHI|nr:MULTISPECIES: TonB-dependent receptor [Sphingobacterium]TJY64348.1 TonB-dependent receptor [Sphingobacterium alkalisoli]TJZ60635.1 TonB-dependent receptor [Sphingobacterium olei]GGH22280.1 SusC/RagA family TonB-linked outer membrane protein [Sphingobacterium alkalisoli]